MLQNLLHEHSGLAGGNRHKHSFGIQSLQHSGNSLIQFILENALLPETLPVLFHCLLCLFLTHPVEFHKTVLQRRPDKRLQLVQIRFFNSEGSQRILYTGADSLFWIRQCPV